MPNTSLREAAPTTSLRDATRTERSVQMPHAPCPILISETAVHCELALPDDCNVAPIVHRGW